MAAAKATLRVGVREHFQLTSAHHLAVTAHQERQKRGTAVTTTGDVKHLSLGRLICKPASHVPEPTDRTVAKINSQKLPSAISALTRDVRERLKT